MNDSDKRYAVIWKRDGKTVTSEATAEELLAAGVPQANIDKVIANDPAERKRRQLEGVEFQGVMLSATKNDQNGLLAVRTDFLMLQQMGQPIPTVHFRFDNGTVLPINAENIMAIEQVWKLFRMSFFPPADAATQTEAREQPAG